MKALIYNENNNETAYYLGCILMNGSITTEEALNLIGLSDDGINRFCAKMGWDGFDLDAVRMVEMADDAPEYERGDELRMSRIFFQHNGPVHFIETPDVIADIWDSIGYYDSVHGTDLFSELTEVDVLPNDGAYTASRW